MCVFTLGFSVSELLNPYWHSSISFIPAIVLASRMLIELKKRWQPLGTFALGALLLYLAYNTVSFIGRPPAAT